MPSSSETSSHGITRWTTPSCAGMWSNGPSYSSPTSSAAERRANERRVRLARDRPPLAVLGQAVVGGRVHGGSDVRRQRPRRRRPDDERLAVPALEREAHVERRVLELPVLAGEDLVLRDRRAAARAPHRRAMALVEPAAPVHLGEEPPDVLDVRVGERVVVGVPVHPHAEALRALGDLLGEARDALAAARGELGEAVLLDLALRVEPERPLDLDLDPEALAVEAVLVALVEAAERLVALEDVLERAPPRVVHAHRVVRRDRAVDEAELAVLRGCARASFSNVPSRSQASRSSSSSALWSGLSGRGVKIVRHGESV